VTLFGHTNAVLQTRLPKSDGVVESSMKDNWIVRSPSDEDSIDEGELVSAGVVGVGLEARVSMRISCESMWAPSEPMPPLGAQVPTRGCATNCSCADIEVWGMASEGTLGFSKGRVAQRLIPLSLCMLNIDEDDGEARKAVRESPARSELSVFEPKLLGMVSG